MATDEQILHKTEDINRDEFENLLDENYKVHGFEDGEVLYAGHLNHMDAQIKSNIEHLKGEKELIESLQGFVGYKDDYINIYPGENKDNSLAEALAALQRIVGDKGEENPAFDEIRNLKANLGTKGEDNQPAFDEINNLQSQINELKDKACTLYYSVWDI